MTVSLSESPGIGKILIENRFSVPNHQRDYSWSQEQIAEFIDDIVEAYKIPDRVYFMGLMVFLSKNHNELIVLDGQQRLATAVMLYSGVRRWLAKRHDHQVDAADIQRDYIGRRELGETTLQPRLTLNSANEQCFNDYIVHAVEIDVLQSYLSGLKKRDRNRKLVEGAIYINHRVETITQKFSNDEDAAKYLFGMINYLREQVGVVKLVVPSEDMAYTIFETLNDRGLELSPLDLVKNHLFGRAAGHSAARLKALEERWAQMMQTLSSVRSDNFLKAFWTSRHGRIRTRSLFSDFKATYKQQPETNQLSMEMLATAEQYAALENADDPVWSSNSEAVRRNVRSLKQVGSQQVHPVMLSAMARMNDKELERILRMLEVCIVRYMLVGSGNTGNFETTCAILARKIYAKEVTTASAAFHEIRSLYPDDSDFQTAFAMKEEENNQRAHYYLRKIETELQRRLGLEMGAELEPALLTVEHILPRHPSSDWSQELSDFTFMADDFTYRLGNMCLLSSVNKKLGNKSFADKKAAYMKSKLEITKAIVRYQDWDPINITARQEEMAKIAVDVWRFQ